MVVSKGGIADKTKGERNGRGDELPDAETWFIPTFRIVRAHVLTHTTEASRITRKPARCTLRECTRRWYCRCSPEWADTKGSTI